MSSTAAGKSTKRTKPAKSNAKPKEPLPAEERIKRLFGSLCAQIDGGHWANAAKSCDKILALSPSDPDALHTKLYLLLQLEQNTQALSLISNPAHQSLTPSLDKPFEKAYALYRLGKVGEARDVLGKDKDGQAGQEWGVLHLKAQMDYREGQYQTAYDTYNELLEGIDPSSEEHSDILTNLSATQSHLDFITSGYSHSLSALPPRVTKGIEQSQPPAPAATSSSLGAVVAEAQAQAEAEKKDGEVKPKQPRKRRIPKHVVIGQTPLPDPERWLKKSERTSFQHPSSKKGKKTTGASQGVILEALPAGTGVVSSSGGGGGAAGGGGGGKKGKKKK